MPAASVFGIVAARGHGGTVLGHGPDVRLDAFPRRSQGGHDRTRISRSRAPLSGVLAVPFDGWVTKLSWICTPRQDLGGTERSLEPADSSREGHRGVERSRLHEASGRAWTRRAPSSTEATYPACTPGRKLPAVRGGEDVAPVRLGQMLQAQLCASHIRRGVVGAKGHPWPPERVPETPVCTIDQSYAVPPDVSVAKVVARRAPGERLRAQPAGPRRRILFMRPSRPTKEVAGRIVGSAAQLVRAVGAPRERPRDRCHGGRLGLGDVHAGEELRGQRRGGACQRRVPAVPARSVANRREMIWKPVLSRERRPAFVVVIT